MKTTIDSSDKKLKAALKFTDAKTKREAVVVAVADLDRRKRLEKLAGIFGLFEDFVTLTELNTMREES